MGKKENYNENYKMFKLKNNENTIYQNLWEIYIVCVYIYTYILYVVYIVYDILYIIYVI